jgi:Spy/CpxP family protein refolding chaperone
MRVRLGVAILAVALLGATYQEKEKEKKGDETPPAKVKGTLPQNFGKLGLSTEQKQKIYRLRAEYRGKIQELEQKIARLRAEQKEAEEAVLTPEQKKKLRELRTGEKAPSK